ncbi:DUF4123 domain-containing protein [Halopseudomonas phragmitis]|nr:MULTISPECIES: DUF4123 domain-containing protein [Pseudomonadaceae]
MACVQSWLAEQGEHAREIYLVMDASNVSACYQEQIEALAGKESLRLYAGTVAEKLADQGPCLYALGSAIAAQADLLNESAHTWEWLIAAPSGRLHALATHWQERLIIDRGASPVLFRLHDYRVMLRALSRLSDEELPAFLGPVESLCVWTGQGCRTQDNPKPGLYPLPKQPAWLENAALNDEVLCSNLRHYLLSEHPEAYSRLAAQRDPGTWVVQMAGLARQWGWHASQQLVFLVRESLSAHDGEIPRHWYPEMNETAQQHYVRVAGR